MIVDLKNELPWIFDRFFRGSSTGSCAIFESEELLGRRSRLQHYSDLTRVWGPLAFWFREMGPRLFQGNLGW